MESKSLPSLLLLPFPPVPPTREALNAAYRPPLAAAVSRLRRGSMSKTTGLVVALPCPILRGSDPRKKSLVWPEAQSLIAGIYTILAVISAELDVATEIDAGHGQADARVVLVDHDRQRYFDEDASRLLEANGTIVPDLPAFATLYRPWREVITVNSELGLQVRETFLRYAERSQTLRQDQLISVDGGLSMHIRPTATGKSDSAISPCHVVCLGGTFDHLHPGHKLLLTAAALLLEVPDQDSGQYSEFVIGITGDELLKKKKFAEFVQPWNERASSVLKFLETLLSLQPNDQQPVEVHQREGDYRASFRNGAVKVQCAVIHDPYGPTITREDMVALVVSAETASGGKAVNDKRTEKGWAPMQIFQVDVLDASDLTGEKAADQSDFSSKLSSTAIRERLSKETPSG
jgi:phosphopantetheine adenylyltransferase